MTRTRPLLAALLALSLPSSALAGKYADIEVDWGDDCSTIVIDATKELSNIVLRPEGGADDLSDDVKTEFDGGTWQYTLDASEVGELDVIWVKAGAFKSGDGPGYGERFDRPEQCDVGSGNVCDAGDGGLGGICGTADGYGGECPCDLLTVDAEGYCPGDNPIYGTCGGDSDDFPCYDAQGALVDETGAPVVLDKWIVSCDDATVTPCLDAEGSIVDLTTGEPVDVEALECDPALGGGGGTGGDGGDGGDGGGF